MRLRREAEARAEHDRAPRISFEVEQGNRLAISERGRFRFKLINHSENAARARIRIRLKMESSDALLPANRAYDGTQVWEITPFFSINGWFDLWEMIRRRAGKEPFAGFDARLNVQVDLYKWHGCEHLFTLRKEYRVRNSPPGNHLEFWPEVATSLPELEFPKRLH